MAQILYIAGSISSMGKLEESEKGNYYLHLIVDENLNSHNEIPIVFFGKNAQKVEKELKVGQFVIVEAELSVYVNSKNGKTWRNVSVVGQRITVNESLNSAFEKVDAASAKEKVKSALKASATNSKTTLDDSQDTEMENSTNVVDSNFVDDSSISDKIKTEEIEDVDTLKLKNEDSSEDDFDSLFDDFE